MKIAGQCDGVRCDMAMLCCPKCSSGPGASARAVLAEGDCPRARDASRLRFMAEVYWDLEWTLQQQGFDYAYDKRLYDRLRDGRARPVREHLHAGLDYQDKLARFLENHDEPRAASAFPWPQHRAAAIGTVKLAESRLGRSRVGRVNGRDEDASRPDLRRPSLPR